VSPLAGAILDLLRAGTPLAVDDLIRVLHARGFEDRPDPMEMEEVEGALEALAVAGRVDILRRRGVPHYRVMHNVQVGSVKA
jgi:hypothetical protein